jgi:hypothetical protein
LVHSFSTSVMRWKKLQRNYFVCVCSLSSMYYSGEKLQVRLKKLL